MEEEGMFGVHLFNKEIIEVKTSCWFLPITYQSTYDLSTANNVYYWVDGYRLINRCNLVIEGVTNAITKGIVTQRLETTTGKQNF
jgi:hypothetical protein